jgi:ribonucleoside-diphosphate reductase alpha chain
MLNGQSNATLMIEKRDGQVVPFDQSKIEIAITNAAVAAGKSQSYIENEINGIANDISKEIHDRFHDGDFHANVENVHDIVEKHLMMANLYEVAKAYILYRADRRRKDEEERKKLGFLRKLTIQKADGRTVRFDPKKLKETIVRCSKGLKIDEDVTFEEAVKNVYDGIKSEEIEKALVLAATCFIETDPDYSTLAARIFRQQMGKEVFGHSSISGTADFDKSYRESFANAIQLGIKSGILDKRLEEFDLGMLSQALKLDRDDLFKYIGLQTLYQRYFTKLDGQLLELPQTFWMRVAMGLAMNEKSATNDKFKEEKAIEFYDVMSQMYLIPSTPTLFHAGLTHAQLSSCYLTTIADDLKDIFKSYCDNSQLSKWSGGIGNDWTSVRGITAFINSTRVESQGTIPFLKIANDTTAAINRSGKRRGATVAYMEPWHFDIEDFIDLRRNTGDERRRAHDMNTALWIPDLFMKRVRDKGNWTLFSPDETPDLHDLYGAAFDKRYEEYERKARRGKIKNFKEIPADKLMRKILVNLFETGHPWLCWKDPCNIRSPQDHVGVVHSSNLCTEITLNTSSSKLIEEVSDDQFCTRKYQLGEIAVCNLSSLVLCRLLKGKTLDKKLAKSVIRTGMRMLDNVIDLCFYPVPEARNSNLRHRPVGLGVMGLQEALYQAGVNFEDASEFVDEMMEYISYCAIEASSDLAYERGQYPSFSGSKWERGLFPLDTLDLLEKERGEKIEVNRTARLDWDGLKNKVGQQGMRNSNCMAIAPTATISTLAGCTSCCEPVFKNVFVESNMSGEFTVINEYLVNDLKALGLWNKEMLDDLKFHDGSVQDIAKIPAKLKAKYKEAFEVDQLKAVELASLRSKWIDQSQSHNVFMKGASGSMLQEIYGKAWQTGLKTTYYLRTLAVTQIEKSTLDASKYGFTQKRDSDTKEVKACRLNDPTCEACQ